MSFLMAFWYKDFKATVMWQKRKKKVWILSEQKGIQLPALKCGSLCLGKFPNQSEPWFIIDKMEANNFYPGGLLRKLNEIIYVSCHFLRMY